MDETVYTIIDSVAGTVKKYPIGSLICSIAPIFDTTAAYVAGKYCNYNGQLYRFDEAHAAGSWTGSDATAVTLSEFLEAIGPDVDDLKEALTTAETTLTHKADKSGVVASAEQLLSDIGTDDKAPYLFRATPYDSTRVDEEVVGVSVGYNQLIPDASKDFTNSTTDTALFKVWIGGNSNSQEFYRQNITATGNFACLVNATANTAGLRIMHFGSVNDIVFYQKSNQALASGHKYLFACNFKGIDPTTVGGVVIEDMMFVDLTAWFGSAIADYAYTLEQATAGSGVAWIKALLPGGYIPYSAPTLKSVEGLSAHVMRDADENIIGNYPLDSDLTLRGILKMDSDHRVYADGDVYLGEGKKNERYAEVDLGTLDWTYNTTDTAVSVPYFMATLSSPKYGAGMMSSKYPNTGGGRNTLTDKTMALYNMSNSPNVCIADSSYSDATAFKTAMDGVKLVYEKATPSEVTAEPFASPQNCEPGGTEEYVYAEGGSGVVVGHNSRYQKNLKGELERVSDAVPDAPSVAGTYSLKATVTAQGVTYAWVSD